MKQKPIERLTNIFRRLALGAFFIVLVISLLNSCQNPGTPPSVPTSLEIKFDKATYDFPQGSVGSIYFTLTGLTADVAEVSFKFDSKIVKFSDPRSTDGVSTITLASAEEDFYSVRCEKGKFALSIEVSDTTELIPIAVTLKYRNSVQQTTTFTVLGRSAGDFELEQKSLAAGYRDFVNFELRDFPASAPGAGFNVTMGARILRGRGVIQYSSAKVLWNDTITTGYRPYEECHQINSPTDMIMFTGFAEGYNVIEFTFTSSDGQYVRTYVDSVLITPAAFATSLELDRSKLVDPDHSIITAYDTKLSFDFKITDSYTNFNRYMIALVDLDYKQISDERVGMKIGGKFYNVAEDFKQFNDLEHYSFEGLYPHYYTTTSNSQMNYAERTGRIVFSSAGAGNGFAVGTYNLRLLVKEQYASSWQVVDCSFTVLPPPVRGALNLRMVSGGSFYPATGTIDLTNAQLPTADLSLYKLTVSSSHPKVLVYAADPAQRKDNLTIDNVKVSGNTFGVMVATEDKFEVSIKLTGTKGDVISRTLTEKELHNNKPSSSLTLGDGHGWCAMNYDFSMTLNYLPTKGFDGQPYDEAVYSRYFSQSATLRWEKVSLLDNVGTLYVNGKELRPGDKLAIEDATNSFAFNTAEPRRNWGNRFPYITDATYMLEGDHTLKLIFTLADGRTLERLITIKMVAEIIPLDLIVKDAVGYTGNKVQWFQGDFTGKHIPWANIVPFGKTEEIIKGSGTFHSENGGFVYTPDPNVKGTHIVDFFYTAAPPFQKSSKSYRMTLEVK